MRIFLLLNCLTLSAKTLCESLVIKDITAQFSYDYEDLSHGKNNICYSTVLNYHIRQIEKTI